MFIHNTELSARRLVVISMLLFMGIGFTHIKRHPRILWFMAFVALVANVLCAYFDVYLQTPPV